MRMNAKSTEDEAKLKALGGMVKGKVSPLVISISTNPDSVVAKEDSDFKSTEAYGTGDMCENCGESMCPGCSDDESEDASLFKKLYGRK